MRVHVQERDCVRKHSLSGLVGGVGGQGGKGGERGTVRPPSPLLRMGAEVALQTGSMASVSEVGSRVRALSSRGVVGVFSYLPVRYFFSSLIKCWF